MEFDEDLYDKVMKASLVGFLATALLLAVILVLLFVA